MQSEIEKAWIEVLAHIYRAVDWSKVRRGGKRPLDVFVHRLEFSRNVRDVASLLQRLCNSLSLQGPKLPLDAIDYLRQNESEAMKYVRKYPKLLALYAEKRARELRKGGGVECLDSWS